MRLIIRPLDGTNVGGHLDLGGKRGLGQNVGRANFNLPQFDRNSLRIALRLHVVQLPALRNHGQAVVVVADIATE